MAQAPGALLENASFWSRYRDLVIGLVIIAAVLGVFFATRRGEPPTPEGEKLTAEAEKVRNEDNIAPPTQPVSAPQEKQEEPKVAEVKTEGGNILVTAAKGNGYTQLARQALKAYLEQNQDKALALTKEHKIFVEDLLQKQVQNKHKLKPGDLHSFSNVDIAEAVDQSLQLSGKQLEHLETFSIRVANL